MAHVLDDNTVIPSFLGLRSRGRVEDTGALTNLGLRLGEVKDIVYPDSPNSVSKRFVEYTVEVQHRDGNGPGTSAIYTGCLISNHFGGAADLFQYSLRKDDGSQKGEDGVGTGSKVLLLCVNGETSRSVIIGGIRDTETDTATVEAQADGHHLQFLFNGVAVSINGDGEFQIQHRGPTDIQGQLDANDDANQPTTIALKKNGNLEITTKDGGQFLVFDHAQKKLRVQADTEWNVQVNGNWILNVDDTISWTGASTCSIAIDDAVTISSGADWNMNADGNVRIKSSGTLIGAASDAMLLASTYRTAETQLHAKLQASLTSLGTLLGTVGATITAACGPLSVPVVGGTLAAPVLAPAGAMLTSAVALITQMVTALATFEVSSPSYLSPKNRND